VRQRALSLCIRVRHFHPDCGSVAKIREQSK
jgi:hypothetical protein